MGAWPTSTPDVDPDVVRAELDRITSSATFLAAPQRTKFLRYVVDETLAGRGDDLTQYKVAVEALGQPSDFDPLVDATVRTYANRLRRTLDAFYTDDGTRTPVRIALESGSYKPHFESMAADVRSDVDRFFQRRPTSAGRSLISPTIAVLPLRNLSPGPDFEYVAAGLTEELVFALTRYSEFTAIGPLSRERLTLDGMGPHEVGDNYGARFVLDGGVGLDAGELRVQVRLTDTSSGANVWAESYIRPFDETAIPGILRSVGDHVLGATADAHGTASRLLGLEVVDGSPLDVDSQQAMLMFHAYLRSMTPESHVATTAALEAARSRDPRAARVLAALGGMYVTDYTHYGDTDDQLRRGLELTEESFRLDPEDHFVQFEGAYVYFYTRDVDEFIRVAELSVVSNPRTSNSGDTAIFFALAGQPDRAMELYDIGRDANPHHPNQFHLAPFLASAYRGDFESALDAANLIDMPGYFLGPLTRAAALGHLGRAEAARGEVEELFELQPGFSDQARNALERLFRYERPVQLVLDGLRRANVVL